jgi:hypothetical protein
LTLGAGGGALLGSSQLNHDRLALIFREVFDEGLVRLLQSGVLFDALDHAIAHPLLALLLAHLSQNDGAFEPFAGHALDVSPVFGVSLM